MKWRARHELNPVGEASPTGMVTTGILPSRDTCTSLYIVGEVREQGAEASRRDSRRGRRSHSKIYCNDRDQSIESGTPGLAVGRPGSVNGNT